MVEVTYYYYYYYYYLIYRNFELKFKILGSSLSLLFFWRHRLDWANDALFFIDF